MSHSMSHKKLKALSKTGGHKSGLRGRVLRAMSSKETTPTHGSAESSTANQHRLNQLRLGSVVEEEEEEEEGKARDSTGVDIEMGGNNITTDIGNISSVVVGARVCLKVVVGMVGTVTGLNGATATVTLDSWSLANGNSVTAYVQSNELNVL
jgi:hypothetical protein